MVHIHGEITKVAEVQTRGYDLPNIQTTGLDYAGFWVTPLGYTALNILGGIERGLMKTLSISVDDTTVLHEFYLMVTDADGVATIFNRGMFYMNFKINLNDFPISSDNTYTIVFGNYTVGWLVFTGNLGYIEI